MWGCGLVGDNQVVLPLFRAHFIDESPVKGIVGKGVLINTSCSEDLTTEIDGCFINCTQGKVDDLGCGLALI